MKKSEVPVIDLHSDLLSFLAHRPGRTTDDPISRSSFPQLKLGHVKLQTLAISSITDSKSVENGKSQFDHFCKLVTEYPMQFAPCTTPLNAQTSTIHLIAAFENASSFASETEPLQHALLRLEGYRQELGPVFYISMTWNDENRFGGGNATSIGLKEDGKRLLEWMKGKQIALDLSHTSDRLAHDQINFIDKHRLDIPIIASHSNFRPICKQPRNLPDDLAKEIIRRKGLIGLNVFAPFIHETDSSAILRHCEYALSLGAENALCFGADFFCDSDFPSFIHKYKRTEAYYPEFANSSCYPSLLGLLVQKLGLKEDQLLKIASQNALHFLNEKIFSF